MVLEEASGDSSWTLPATDSLSDTNPDAYALSVDLSSLAGPLPLLGPAFGFTEPRTRALLAQALRTSQVALRRPLQETEREALAEDICLRQRALSKGPPIGVALGLVRAYQTRATWRLPFWAMGQGFDPAVVRVGRAEVLRGDPARLFWRGLRGSLYSANGAAFAMLIAVQYAMAMSTVRLTTDPRLKDLYEAIRDMAKDDRAARAQRMQKEREKLRAQARGGQPQRGQEQAATARQDAGWDDASPSGGAAMEDYSYASSAQGSFGADAGASSVSSARTPPSTQQQQRGQRGQPAQQDRGFYDDWDDNSPTGRPTPPRQANPAAQEQQPGSAWERLRQRAAGDQGQQAPQGEGQRSRESYAFSSQDQDRQFAREEAQRQFDARIERERGGGEFDSGGAKKW